MLKVIRHIAARANAFLNQNGSHIEHIIHMAER
jgi:hypothetical protein